MDRQRITFPASTSSVLWLQIFAIFLCLALNSACGGGRGGGDVQPPPPTASTSVQFRIGDASSDRLVSVEATIEAVFLTNSAGASIKVVPVSHQLEFTHLSGTLQPLYVSDVVQDTYTQLAIDGRDLHVSYLDSQGKAQEYTFSGTTRIPVTLNPPLVVGSQATIVSIDFDLAGSIAVDPSNQSEPFVDPVFTVSSVTVAASQQQPENGAVEDVVGRVEGVSAGGAVAILGRDKVEIDGDRFVLLIIKIDNRATIQNSSADCGDEFFNRRRVELFIFRQFPACERNRQTRAGDCGGPRSPIRLQYIAIDPHRSRPKLFKIHDGTEGSANQALNFSTSPVQPAFGNVARFSSRR